jgi:hypothetical protein
MAHLGETRRGYMGKREERSKGNGQPGKRGTGVKGEGVKGDWRGAI